jgi:peptidoglycan hydrolase FlgJ
MEVSTSISSMASLSALHGMSTPGAGGGIDDARAVAEKSIESMFLSILMKSMRESGLGDGLFAGDKSDAMGAMFDQYMAEHLADGGGIGIGSAFAKQAIREPTS